ncbi:MAG TPA: glycosyltransferase [Gaiellaceae bacterium]|jgi:O-antigen/teichoic acid export membrane protein/glycosyltransferase involved in cell wall biosynthesis|nr:glycosyltransferase [Gaiellaceae bacterium]
MSQSDGPSGGERLAVRLAANTIVQIAGNVLAAAISFFTFVAMTRGLGPDSYGDYVAATSFLFLPIVLSDLGLATTVLRDISARPEDTEAVMRRSVPLRAGLSAVAVAVMVLLGLVIPFAEQTKLAILIWSVGAWATLMNVAVLPVLQAQLRMHWAVAANVVGRTVALGLTLGALATDAGFAGVVWAQVVGVVVTFLFDVAVVRRMVPLAPILDLPYWRTLVRGSIVIGLAIGLGQVFFKIDGVILALVRPAAEVGFYGAAYKFLEVSDLLVAAIALSVFPTLTHYAATGSQRLRPLVQRTFDVLLAVATAVALLFLFFAEELVVLSSGREFAAGADALRLLAPYPMLFFVNALMWRVLIAAEHDRVLLKIAASVLTFNVALNVALLPPYGFRAAAVTAVASELVSITASAIVLRRRMGFLPSVGYAWAIALAALAATVVALFLPGPWPIAAAAALAAYTLVLLVLPGTAREGLAQMRRELRPASAPDAAAAAEPSAPAPPLAPRDPGPVELSVVIAARNASDTIGAQLESLARQNWDGKWEVVVVDNGSTDDTMAVAESFAERLPALRVVSANRCNRIPYARNRGVEAARGRLIAFCDADDEVSPGWLAAVAAGLERYGAVATPKDHDRLNEPWVRDSRDPPTPDGLHLNWYPPYLPHTGSGGMGVRREAHEAIGGFDEALLACEDNDYCFRLQLHGFDLGPVEGAVYHYRFKDEIGAIFRQAYWYSEQNARVQRMYRTANSRIPRRWAWPVKNWPALLRAVPGAVRKGGRGRLAWMVGWELGRLRGSIRHRVLAV